MDFQRNDSQKNYGLVIPDSYIKRVLNTIELLPTTKIKNISSNKDRKKLEGALIQVDYEPHIFLSIRLNSSVKKRYK